MDSFKLFLIVLSFIPSISALSFLNLFNLQQQRALTASSLRNLNDFNGRTSENQGMESVVYNTAALEIPQKPLPLKQLPKSMTALRTMTKPRPLTSIHRTPVLRHPFRTKSGSNIIRAVPVEGTFRQLPTTPVTSIYQAMNTKQIPVVQYPIMFGTRLELQQESQQLPMRNYYNEGTRYLPKKQYVNFINTQPLYLNNLGSTTPINYSPAKKVKFVTNNLNDDGSRELYSTSTLRYKNLYSPSDDIKPVEEIVDENNDDTGFQIQVNGVIQNHKIEKRK